MTHRLYGIVAAFALVVQLAVATGYGWRTPMASDAFYYLDLARSLADGAGYVERNETYWPGQPAMGRLPAWPALVAVALRLLPGVDPNLAMRWVGVLVQVAAAAGIAAFAQQLLRRPAVSLVAGILYVLHPAGLLFGVTGLSEPWFVCLAAWGTAGLLRGGWTRPAGALALGVAVLVRANFLLWLPAAGALLLLLPSTRRRLREPRVAAQAALCAALFLLPPLAWTARNALVSGRFPVLSTLRGQTFYGGNNPVVANTLEYWGYWVFPDQIPGETPMRELAATRSEVEVDAHYTARGRAFVRENWKAMPRLWLGKLIRAYVPVPWKPLLGSWVVSLFRWGLIAAVLAGLALAWRRVPALGVASLLGMALVSVAAVLAFWGYIRFAFALETFLLPFAAVALVAWAGRVPCCGPVVQRILALESPVQSRATIK